ncbi:DUF5825 family protein [Actinacidiphila paucisporea]|uniref:Uncharacterized protein n=1 Tax=Actinacidiphila paucisporea TaxID=310782 RepID=A0A1M7P0U3_9ACTN|nr:DUF5825 family protein [Actinacidiphila paucisporea]SHN10063.1 hypothetical protein SAMN05216499_12099 [Actinacidiphila paucisporea]
MTTSTVPTDDAPAAPDAGALAVSAWRDYDPEVCAVPGMGLGERRLTGPVAEEATRLWADGARRVRLAEAVDLTAAGSADGAVRAVRQLSLIRDLTARAVLVEWTLRTATDDPEGWRALGHLQPPQHVHGLPAAAAADQLRDWREGHYVGLCLWRQGPGFVQIRDRRWGGLARFTVDEPHYQQAIARLSYGALAGDVPDDALSDFLGERLVLPFGRLNWWAPYRVARWSRGGIMV